MKYKNGFAILFKNIILLKNWLKSQKTSNLIKKLGTHTVICNIVIYKLII